jgi:lysophospholipase L1-like esterase
MSEFTYENKDTNFELETFEWDNVWLDHITDPTLPRILYIGDSISCGTRRVATIASGEKLLFDGFGTSKALDNPYFKESLLLFARQQPHRNAIIINNGLHGWHINDGEEYKNLYKNMLEFLMENFKDTPLYIITTTHVANPEREQRVIVRNKMALELAKELNLGVIDFYALSAKNPELVGGDGVHFTPDGYKALAEALLETFKDLY